jgi:hypothetical protein
LNAVWTIWQQAVSGPVDVFDANASNKQSVANQPPMAARENRSGTHERTALADRQFHDPLNVSGELRRLQFVIPRKAYRANASEPGKKDPFHRCKYRAILARRLEHVGSPGQLLEVRPCYAYAQDLDGASE